MLLLVSGASGVGKSMAGVLASRLLAQSNPGEFEHAEFYTLAPIPEVPTVTWRHQMAEVAAQRAIALAAEGRHLLFAGDPIPAGEMVAVPSADAVDIAVLMLDADEAAQTARLDGRQDPPEWLPNNLGFANWMRHHAVDPSFVPERDHHRRVARDALGALARQPRRRRALGDGGARHVVHDSGCRGGHRRRLGSAGGAWRSTGVQGRLVRGFELA